ncbi:MAG: endonuclease domain-containing protein [Oscillospiraceae bacterium]|nr:endonuclease domain-containing protein [Oscillospiraceae bacterium]
MERKHNPALTQNARKLRKSMTKEERRLWHDFLKNYPMRFLRQKVIDDYIVDFYCHDARLVIELDGSQHYQQENEEKDNIRTEKMESRGLTVIRIANIEINRNFEGVCRYIDTILNQK